MKNWTESDAWYFAHRLSKIGRLKLGGEGANREARGTGEGSPPETPVLFTSPPLHDDQDARWRAVGNASDE